MLKTETCGFLIMNYFLDELLDRWIRIILLHCYMRGIRNENYTSNLPNLKWFGEFLKRQNKQWKCLFYPSPFRLSLDTGKKSTSRTLWIASHLHYRNWEIGIFLLFFPHVSKLQTIPIYLGNVHNQNKKMLFDSLPIEIFL